MEGLEVRFHAQGAPVLCESVPLDLRPGDPVVVETERGTYLAVAAGLVARQVVENRRMRRVVRRAGEEDRRRSEDADRLADRILRAGVRAARASRLPIKVVQVDVPIECDQGLLHYSCEERLDLRGFHRMLGQEIRVRVETHQIGVREGSGDVGGIGPCGLSLCCGSFLRTFGSVGVRAAKSQGLSPNPQKVTGMCGRLKCCLLYEQSVYQELAPLAPRAGASVMTAEGAGRVLDADVIGRRVLVALEEGGRTWFLMRDVAQAGGDARSLPGEAGRRPGARRPRGASTAADAGGAADYNWDGVSRGGPAGAAPDGTGTAPERAGAGRPRRDAQRGELRDRGQPGGRAERGERGDRGQRGEAREEARGGGRPAQRAPQQAPGDGGRAPAGGRPGDSRGDSQARHGAGRLEGSPPAAGEAADSRSPESVEQGLTEREGSSPRDGADLEHGTSKSAKRRRRRRKRGGQGGVELPHDGAGDATGGDGSAGDEGGDSGGHPEGGEE